MRENIAIKTNLLTKKFGDFTAVDRITFDVKEGEIFGFLGANGAGKTTAIKMLIGLSHPTSGDANVAGYDIYQETDLIKNNIGYMSQKFSLYEDLTILENIRFYGGIYGLKRQTIKDKTAAIISHLNLESHATQLVASIPLGWKQRLAFAIANVHDPKIIFLDEPTGGVDPATRRQFWEMIYETAAMGTTIFVTTHYMDEAEYCNRISIMVDGRIAAMGSPRVLKNEYNAESMDDVFLNLVRNQSAKTNGV